MHKEKTNKIIFSLHENAKQQINYDKLASNCNSECIGLTQYNLAYAFNLSDIASKMMNGFDDGMWYIVPLLKRQYITAIQLLQSHTENPQVIYNSLDNSKKSEQKGILIDHILIYL